MNYVDFVEQPDGLHVKLLPEGRAFLEEQKHPTLWESDRCWARGTDDILHDLFERQLCNGWAAIRPEHIDAMTDSIILSPDATFDETVGGFVPFDSTSPVYWQPNYAVDDELAILLEKGEYVYKRAS